MQGYFLCLLVGRLRRPHLLLTEKAISGSYTLINSSRVCEFVGKDVGKEDPLTLERAKCFYKRDRVTYQKNVGGSAGPLINAS